MSGQIDEAEVARIAARVRGTPFDQWTLGEKLAVAAVNIRKARRAGLAEYLAGWEHLPIQEAALTLEAQR